MTVLAKSINKIIDEGTNVHFERLTEMRVIWTALLARKHPFLLGVPGTNKTRLIDWVCNSIVGASFYEKLCNNQLGVEDFLGPIDMVAYDQQNLWQRKYDGYLPTADVAMLDECFKANGSVLNPLLDVLVRFKADVGLAHPLSVPTLMIAMASNELPSGEELGAFWDRRGPALIVNPIQEAANFDKLLQLAAGDLALHPSVVTPTTVDLADVQKAVLVEVPQIIVPQGIRDAVRNLKEACEHPSDGLPRLIVSDRRWYQLISMLQAAAYLADRDTVEDDDLQISRFFLWETPEMRQTVDKRVMTLSSPQTAKAMEISESVDGFLSQINASKGQSSSARAELGAEINGKIKKMFAEVASLKQEALAAGRSTTKIDEVTAHVGHLRTTVLIECLNVPREAAEKLAAGA